MGIYKIFLSKIREKKVGRIIGFSNILKYLSHSHINISYFPNTSEKLNSRLFSHIFLTKPKKFIFIHYVSFLQQGHVDPIKRAGSLIKAPNEIYAGRIIRIPIPVYDLTFI